MKRLIASCDVYGRTPNFLYNGMSSCKTVWGGWITILVFICQLLCIIYITYRHFERSSPETNINRKYTSNPIGFDLTNDTLPFGFGLEFANGSYFIDDSIYTTEVVYFLINKKSENGHVGISRRRVPLEVTSCDEVGLSQEIFRNLPLSSMKCIRNLKDQKLNLTITGEWESPLYGYISIKISKCSGSHCRPKEEIDQILKKSYFAINYMNFAAQTSNFSEPTAKYPASFYTTTSSQFTKEIQMRMADNEILTYSSLLGSQSSPSKISYTSVDRFVTDVTEVAAGDQSPSTLVILHMRMDPVGTITHRVYRNVFQSLAELGGMLNVICVAAVLLTCRIAEILLMVDLSRVRSSRGKPGLSCSGLQSLRSKIRNLNNEQATVKETAHFEANFLVSEQSPKLSRVNPLKKKNLGRPQVVERPKKLVTPSIKVFKDQPKPEERKLLRKQETNPFILAGGHPLDSDRQNPSISHPLSHYLEISCERQRTKEANRSNFSKLHSSIKPLHIALQAFFPKMLSKRAALKEVLLVADQYKSSFDFFTILDLLEDMKKLKLMLLSPEQFVLFDLVASEDVEQSTFHRAPLKEIVAPGSEGHGDSKMAKVTSSKPDQFSVSQVLIAHKNDQPQAIKHSSTEDFAKGCLRKISEKEEMTYLDKIFLESLAYLIDEYS